MRGPATAVVAATALASAAAAHHGFGTFDLNQDIELTGTLTGLDFVNPHSWLYLDVTEESGEITSYRCEMRGATVLRRSGWSPEMFRIGERITITGSPDRRDRGSCYLGTVTFADGSSMDRYGQLVEAAPPPEDRPARTSWGAPNLAGDWAPEQVVMTDPRGIVGTLVPLSTADDYEPGQVPAGATPFPGSRGADPSLRSFATVRVELTPTGQALADAYEDLNPEKNPRMRCEATSVIFDWTFDGMIHRIEQTPETITISYGQYGTVRTIHLDEVSHPADLSPSRAGHSIGRFEGDVLVVDTTGFAPGLLSPPIHHGDKLHIVERFTLDPETWMLRRDYEATDPDYFVGAYTGGDVVGLSPLPHAPDACVEQSFVNYAEERSSPTEAARPWWRFWE